MPYTAVFTEITT